MKEFKIGLTLLFCFLVIGNVYCGGQNSNSAKQKVEISIMSMGGGPEEHEMFEIMLKLFNGKTQDISVKYTPVPGTWSDSYQKYMALIAAGTPPDISRIAGGASRPNFLTTQLLDLTDLIKRDLNMADYYEYAFEANRINGKIWGVPTGIYTQVVYYNKRMFDKAGIPYPRADWNNPWTKDEFLAIARKLTTPGNEVNKNYGFFANTNWAWTAPFYFSDGGSIFSADGKAATMDSKQVVDAYKLSQSMINEGVSPTPAQLQTMNADQLFMSDRLGMMINGQWMIVLFNANKDLTYGVAPVPKGTSSATTVNFIDHWSIYSSSKHHNESWQVLKFLISEEIAEFQIKNGILGTPVNKRTVERMKDQIFPGLSNAEKDVILKSIDYSKPFPYSRHILELADTADKTFDLITLNRVSVEDGLRNLNNELNTMIRNLGD